MNGFISKAMRTFVSILLVVFALFLCAAPLMADEAAPLDNPAVAPVEDKPAVSLYVDILSQYIFRGVALSRDSAVIQPSGTVSYKGFSVNIWGNFDTVDHMNTNGNAKWNETDFTFAYTHEIFCKELNATAGGVYYALTELYGDTFEVFGGLSYAFPWLTMAVTGYRDVENIPGWWMQIDLTRNFALPWCGTSVDLGASFGYSDNDYVTDWVAGTLSAALNIPVGKYFTISPKVGYAFPLGAGSYIQANSWDGRENHVFGGVRVTAAF